MTPNQRNPSRAIQVVVRHLPVVSKAWNRLSENLTPMTPSEMLPFFITMNYSRTSQPLHSVTNQHIQSQIDQLNNHHTNQPILENKMGWLIKLNILILYHKIVKVDDMETIKSSDSFSKRVMISESDGNRLSSGKKSPKDFDFFGSQFIASNNNSSNSTTSNY